MELAEEKSPSEDSEISSPEYCSEVSPERQSEHKSNETSDHRSSHPEREPDENKQADDAIFLYDALSCFCGFSCAFEDVFWPFDDQYMLPAEDEQGIEDKDENSFNYDADWYYGSVAECERVSEGHSCSASEHDLSGGHSDDDLRIGGRKEELNTEPKSE